MQKILVIAGSTRPTRKSEAVARWFIQTAKDRNNFNFEFVDLADVNLPMLDEPVPAMFGKYKNQHTKDWTARLAAADGFVVVTPEYNHGYPGVLKNAIDFAYAEWNRKPVGFVSYGVAGGVRAVEQLKQVFVQLDAVPINTQVSFTLFNSWDKDGKLLATDHDVQSAEKLLAELEWWGETLKAGREKR